MDGKKRSGLIIAASTVKNPRMFQRNNIESFMTKTFRLFFLATFAASLTFTNSLCAAIPPAENLLPSDTLFVVTAPDCIALRSAMHDSPQWTLWGDPAMKPFHDKFVAKVNETLVAPLEKDLGVKLADFADLPQGQFTFAVTQNGWNGTSDPLPAMILLLDTKDKSDSLKTTLAALQKKWADSGKTIRTENVRGIKFSVVPLSTNDIPAALAGIFGGRPGSELGRTASPAKSHEIIIGQFESLLIVGNSIKAVEPVAAHLTGGSAPALSDNAIFAADKLVHFRNSPVYYGWFNGKALFTVLAHIPEPAQNPDAPSPIPRFSVSKALVASGLTGLKSVSFATRESHDGSEADFYFSVPEADRAGLFKMIVASPKDGNPPPFVPADAMKYWRWRLDGQKAWATLETMLGNISPAALNTINAAMAMANASAQMQDPDFDLKKNLIGNLGDDIINYQKAATGTSIADLNNAPSLFLVGASNPDKAVGAMKSVLSLMYKGGTEPRDFLGKMIYSISLTPPATPGSTAMQPSGSFYYAASSGYVAMSTDSSILESYLRNPGSADKPLNQVAGLADAAQHIGGTGNGLFGYQNQREVMRSAFTLLKNHPGNATGMGSMAALPPAFRDWMDFSLLPDYDQVSKYFFFSVFNGSATADGISFKAFAPRAPGL
jgi:hypothetical protein